MISDDTLMGTSLMTFPVAGLAWQFCCSEKKRSRKHPVCSNHHSPFFDMLTFLCLAVAVKYHGNKACFSILKYDTYQQSILLWHLFLSYIVAFNFIACCN